MSKSDDKSKNKQEKMPADEEMVKLGITRVVSEQFHYGDYRYSSLKDAMAQAKRGQTGSRT